MKIVFIAPPSEKKIIVHDYETVIDVCKKLGYTVDATYLTTDIEAAKKYKHVITEIKKVDVVIAEATTLTVDISRLITLSLQYHIPTLVLYREKSPVSFVFESSRLLLLKHYSMSTIEDVLKNHLKKISKKKLIYRFNLMLTKELGSYVMDKSKQSNVSKADYIRQLISADMEDET